jgi:uncharacterized membrane protein
VKDGGSQNAINQHEWEQPGNWTGWFGTYSSPRDTRLFVPNRVGGGMMPNTGHLIGKVLVGAFLLLVIGLPLLAIIWRGIHG